MGSDKIKILLDKYWNGLTSLEEEAQIKEYFSKGDYEKKWQSEADLFLYYMQQSTLKSSVVSDDIEAATNVKTNRKDGKVLRLLWTSLKVAAVIIVVITAGWVVRSEMQDSKEQLEPIADTFTDPNEAFEETKKALLLISKNLGKGRSEASKLKAFNKAEEVVKSTGKKRKEEENI